MPEDARIIGAARTKQSEDDYRNTIAAALQEFLPEKSGDRDTINSFLQHIRYVAIDATGTYGWKDLAAMVREEIVQAFYFSVGPALFGALAERLHEHGIANDRSRIVVEKPFGRDLESACALNATLAEHFDESQIYRIDHYLGKETVQNLMAIRFGNILFEPLWNAQYIDHIQITVAETVGVGGRGGILRPLGRDA